MMFASKDVSLQSKYVNSQISELKGVGLSPVVLTCKTESGSVLRDCFSRKSDGGLVWSGTSVPVYSCRRFKGLEANAVILIDVSDECWAEQWADYNPSPGLVFYTGASRAKHELRIVCDMDNEAAERVLQAFGIESKRKPTSRLAKRLNANLVERV